MGGGHLPNCPARRERAWGSHYFSPNSHQDSKIRGLNVCYFSSKEEISEVWPIPLIPKSSSECIHHHYWNRPRYEVISSPLRGEHKFFLGYHWEEYHILRKNLFSNSWHFMASWKVTEGIRTTVGWWSNSIFHWPSFQQIFLQYHRAGWSKANIFMQGSLVKKTSHLENKFTFPNVCLYLGRNTKVGTRWSGGRKCKLRVRVLFLVLTLTPELCDFCLSLALSGHLFPLP